MAFAHVCMSCGTALARVRAWRDPHYGLMLVRCPTCSTIAARRRRGASTSWRRTRGALVAAAAAVFNLAGVLGLLALATAAVCWLLMETERQGFFEMGRRNEAPLVMAFIVLPLVVGTWLASAFGHLRRHTAWITFGVLVVILMSVVVFVEHLDRAWRMNAMGRWPGFDSDWTVPAAWMTLRGAALIYMFMLVALLGAGPAALLQRLWGWGRRMLWRARRRGLSAERRA